MTIPAIPRLLTQAVDRWNYYMDENRSRHERVHTWTRAMPIHQFRFCLSGLSDTVLNRSYQTFITSTKLFQVKSVVRIQPNTRIIAPKTTIFTHLVKLNESNFQNGDWAGEHFGARNVTRSMIGPAPSMRTT